MAEYNKKNKQLEEIAHIFTDISPWLIWWDVRKYNMFPAFRLFGYSNVTLAKIGNSMIKHHMQLWFLEAALDDNLQCSHKFPNLIHSLPRSLLQVAKHHAT